MKVLFSSLGKKIQVAFSGILLATFLVFHLMNNLVLFSGPESFNQMVSFLDSIKPLVRIMEAGLTLVLLLHTINALKLTYENRQLRLQGYDVSNTKSSTISSRTMAISGSIILLFIFIHLGYIWWTYQTHNFLYIDETYYDVILRSQLGYLNHTPTAVFYIIAIFFIGFHLKHGYQSSLKTFGVQNLNSGKILYGLGFLFWGLIPFGFILIVISIKLGCIH